MRAPIYEVPSNMSTMEYIGSKYFNAFVKSFQITLENNMFRAESHTATGCYTICPRSYDPSYIVTYYIKRLLGHLVCAVLIVAMNFNFLPKFLSYFMSKKT